MPQNCRIPQLLPINLVKYYSKVQGAEREAARWGTARSKAESVQSKTKGDIAARSTLPNYPSLDPMKLERAISSDLLLLRLVLSVRIKLNSFVNSA